MKFIQIQFLNFRIWLLRRRLRRMGLRQVAQATGVERLMALSRKDYDEQKLILDWIKVIMTALAILSTWVIFWLRGLDQIQIILPPAEHTKPTPHFFVTWEPEPRSSSFCSI